MSAPESPRPLHVRVSPAAERAIRSGHPWVYSDSIRDQNREGATGDLGVIFDRRDRFLAIGLLDTDSPLRIRILHAGPPTAINDAFWRARLETALERRSGIFGPDTTGYRCLYGESDGWPGLVLDRYGDTLVLKAYTAAWLPRLKTLLDLLRDRLAPDRLVLRFSRNTKAAAEAAGFWDGANAWPAGEEDRVAFLENGLTFESEVVRGQKTGFFLDQRDNRQRLERKTQGADVLNVFSFTGGFSLYAARGGARSVTDLDISAHALTQARRNFACNARIPSVASARHEQIQADAFEWLASNSKPRFDVLILDPPSLARRESERAEALLAYGRLASSGLRLLRPGGLLLAASCSAHVSASEFFATVRNAANRHGKAFRELETTGHPADHAATFAEAAYLKAIFLQLEPAPGRGR
ncbi:MAG: class I SAM-dependent methyltransferase [Verrucomicrobiota bacterium]